MTPTLTPTFFKTSAAFRAWLTKNHATKTETLLGFYRIDAGLAGIAYQEAVDEALCFGWIDGVVKKIDDVSYSHRFTPRTAKSIWSLVNLRHVERLLVAGRMTPAGVRAYEARDAARTGIYAFENKSVVFGAAEEKRFRANKPAWNFWEAQPPGWKRTATHWVMSAKQEATRERRLAELIADSARGVRLGTGKK